MAEMQPFKEQVDAAAVRRLGEAVGGVLPGFDVDGYVAAVAARLPELELKDRVRHAAAELRARLPEDFEEAARVLRLAADGPGLEGMIGWVPAQVVEEYGLGHFEASMDALHRLTRLFTAEFAIRPFLLAMPERTLARLASWVDDPDEHARRLVSEGTRTRLPWGGRLQPFIDDPTPVLALLERLRDDPALYVRRSVANNLNDLSKDHPERVVDVLTRWTAEPLEHRGWIARHALRTLVKAGHPGALRILGFGRPEVSLVDFHASDAVRFGDALEFGITLASTTNAAQRLLIDFAVHHVKANGTRTAKVFKWTKRELGAGGELSLTKQHRFRSITTRRYYPGRHAVELLVNGESLGMREFDLVME